MLNEKKAREPQQTSEVNHPEQSSKIHFYTGIDTREVYVIRNDPEFAGRMLARTAMLTSD